MKLGDFLTTLARKSNMNEDKALIDILSNSTLANTEIADSFANQLDSSLMSLEGAKNNPTILNHFKPIILKAADDKFAILAEKYGFTDDLQAEKSTYKKFDILESKIEAKIAELESKQGKTNNAEKEAQLTRQIAEMQQKLADLNDAKVNEVKAVTSQYENQITDMFVNGILKGKKYVIPDLDVDVVRGLLNKELKAKGAVLVRVNGEMKLKQADNPEMDFVDAGFKPVSFSDFTDKTLADKNLLDVSGGQQQQTHTPAQPQRVPGNNINDSKFQAAMADAVGSTN